MTQVQLQKVDPPAAVIESFRDVQRANTDAERMRNEAEAYRNDIVPRARGDAARIIAEAEGAKQASIAEATGQSQRFMSVLDSLQGRQGRDLAAHVYRDDAGHPEPLARRMVVDDKLKGWCRSCRCDLRRSRAGARRRGPRPAPQAGTTAAGRSTRDEPPRPPRIALLVVCWSSSAQRQPVHRGTDRAGADHAVRQAGAGHRRSRAAREACRSCRR